MSVDFWPLKYYGGEKEALLLIQNCLLLLHSVALTKVKDPPPKIRGAAKKMFALFLISSFLAYESRLNVSDHTTSDIGQQ